MLRAVPDILSPGSTWGGGLGTSALARAASRLVSSSSPSAPLPPRAPLAPGLLEAFTRVVGPDRISTAPSVLSQHGTDESYHTPVPPDVVSEWDHSSDRTLTFLPRVCHAL
jgi:hypothetical protein